MDVSFIPHFLYPVIRWSASGLIPYHRYCELSCCKHGVTDNSLMLISFHFNKFPGVKEVKLFSVQALPNTSHSPNRGKVNSWKLRWSFGFSSPELSEPPLPGNTRLSPVLVAQDFLPWRLLGMPQGRQMTDNTSPLWYLNLNNHVTTESIPCIKYPTDLITEVLGLTVKKN